MTIYVMYLLSSISTLYKKTVFLQNILKKRVIFIVSCISKDMRESNGTVVAGFFYKFSDIIKR